MSSGRRSTSACSISGRTATVAVDVCTRPPDSVSGTLRIRGKGSDGGHNGLKNIAESLGHNNYARLRFGIGGDFPKGFQVDYVLGTWTKEEADALPERLDMAGEVIRSFATAGLERTMNAFNNK